MFDTAITKNPDKQLEEISEASIEGDVGPAVLSIEKKRKIKKERKQKRPRKEQDEQGIGSMVVECSRISDLTERENACVQEIMLSLQSMVKGLDTPIHFNPLTLMNKNNSISDAFLTPQGTICTVDAKGTTSTMRIEEISPESLITILVEIIPRLRKLVIERENGAKHKVSTFESMTNAVKYFLSRV